MKYIDIKAYAKVNFILNVLGKRPDGYHELSTVMQAVELWDDVSVGWEIGTYGLRGAYGRVPSQPFELAIELSCDNGAVPVDGRNLAYKAAVLMHEEFHKGVPERIAINIQKRIPMAAGLAGGSADGAAAVNGLARLWRITDEQRLFQIMCRLGADVPFCAAAQNGSPAALAKGTGTELTPIRPLNCKLLLSTPDVPVPTAAVYSELSPADYNVGFSCSSYIAAAKASDVLAASAAMGNHLQAPALRLYPEIQRTITALKAMGRPLRVQQSGSGPTIFALYEPGCTDPTESSPAPNPQTYFINTLL